MPIGLDDSHPCVRVEKDQFIPQMSYSYWCERRVAWIFKDIIIVNGEAFERPPAATMDIACIQLFPRGLRIVNGKHSLKKAKISISIQSLPHSFGSL